MKENNILFAIALLAVIASAGNAAAIAEPVFGWVNTTAADGDVVMLWLEDDRINNPSQNVSVGVGHNAPSNSYYFMNIEPLLIAHGKNAPGTVFNVTTAILCSGVNQSGIPYTNTYHNDTGVTQQDHAGIAGPTYMQNMSLLPCAVNKPSFNKTLYAGWNLISLPLDPDDNSASAVLSTASYDAVYRYNATSKKYEIADVMDPGIGYFVNATADCEWEYSGTPYTSMDVSLEHGLNMVGWLNCSKDVGDTLSSISGKYHYVAQWNASAEKFEVYNPAAPDPSVFNDFTTMDRGIGYFIAAKQGCILSESC